MTQAGSSWGEKVITPLYKFGVLFISLGILISIS